MDTFIKKKYKGQENRNVISKEIPNNNSTIVDGKAYSAKQICLVCKGNGAKRNNMHFFLALILGIIVFPIVAIATGGAALVASVVVIFWGVKKKPCKTCNGTGYLVM